MQPLGKLIPLKNLGSNIFRKVNFQRKKTKKSYWRNGEQRSERACLRVYKCNKIDTLFDRILTRYGWKFHRSYRARVAESCPASAANDKIFCPFLIFCHIYPFSPEFDYLHKFSSNGRLNRHSENSAMRTYTRRKFCIMKIINNN